MFRTLLLSCIAVAAISVVAFAGLNTDAKVAVHVLPHASRTCSGLPTIAGCADIIETETSHDVDAFPVFFDMVEYQGFDYGMSWPGLYSCVFTSCSYLTIGDIVWPGDGIAHAWATCQPGPVGIPGWAWIFDFGTVCVIPHPLFDRISAADCQGGTTADSVLTSRSFCAGIGGSSGENPCGTMGIESSTWGDIKAVFK
ncbi:MAG: hypothetical protein ABIJ00_00360 [Candidatus Eisenbacteria bacterium]